MVCPHEGHLDRPATTLSFRGMRCVTTVRKEPTSKPNTPKTSARIMLGRAYRAVPSISGCGVDDLPLVGDVHVVADDRSGPWDAHRKELQVVEVLHVDLPSENLPAQSI